MFRYSLILLVLFCTNALHAQYISGVTMPDSTVVMDTSAQSFNLAKSITPSSLRKHLTILASDEYEGRETGQPGNYKAAEYIKNHFKSIGIIPVDGTYYQDVMFTWESWNNITFSARAKEYKHLWDFLAFQNLNNSAKDIEVDDLYFLGYGIDDPNYTDYRRPNRIKGKSILIYSGEPVNREGNSRITGTSTPSDWSGNIEKKLEAAKKYGVKNVFIIADDLKALLAKNRRELLGSKVKLGKQEKAIEYPPNIVISTTIAKDLIGKRLRRVVRARERITKRGKSKMVRIKNVGIEMDMDKNIVSLEGHNVMGYIEGTDKKDELVVISAHYDHLGKRGESIYNGADDNGSGTTTLLDVASAYARGMIMGQKPRRSVLFLLVTGEEKGLLGSAYYADKPIFPLKKTVVDINVDMVGRVDDKYQDNPNYIYVIGSDRLSTDLHKINEKVNNDFEKLVLDYTYNDENDPNRYYYRSDHYNFAKNGIPAIFFFNGTHEDYHKVTDTVEKINFDKMAKIGRHIFHLSWNLANRDDRIVVDGEVKK